MDTEKPQIEPDQNGMKLTLGDANSSLDVVTMNPTDSDIADALSIVAGGKDLHFAILGYSEVFIQVQKNPPGKLPSYHLESMEGMTGRNKELYEADSMGLMESRIVEAFRRYARRDPAWKRMFTWTSQVCRVLAALL